MNTMPKVALKPGDRLDAFVVRSVTPIDELRAIAVVLEHPGCGATLLHLVQNDAENLFSVTFKTPPSDDTGVPHILEHAVLAGSAKYPVRDPFFEMLKRSMATYLNAFTMWDATSYPVASNVKQDLFNLADVYFDAVFHPKLTEETFAREGHHLAPVDPADPTGALRVTGIVYNEMKGAFSNPEARLQRVARRTLFGDTIYGHESGGDPDAIPDLTWADLRAFHERYYHPSNALFFVYGDIPTSEWTAFLTARLAGFKPRPADFEIKPQPLWREPRRLDESYAVGAGESLAEKTYLSLRWIVGDSTDPGEITDWRVLSTILLGNEAAPLKRALIASKLGQDLFASGLDANALQSGFGVGLKGAEANRAEAFERLVLDCLRDLAGQTFTPERVEAAYQQAAYFYLEILPSYPLYMLFRVLGTWVHDRDPLAYLPMREHLAASKARYAADPRRFNRMIAEHLVENPHRLLTVMQPDLDWQTRADARFAERMQRVRAALSDEEAKHISEAAAELDRRSSTPDPPELLATLPVLSVDELPPAPRHVPTHLEALPGGITLLRNDVFANGVGYLELSFDLSGLPDELVPYLPYYTASIRQLGAAGQSYEQIAARIAANTGGIDCWADFNGHAQDPNRLVPCLRFSLKSLDSGFEPALAVLSDLVWAVDPRDRERLLEVVTQKRSRTRTALVQEGLRTASLHAARGFSRQSALTERIQGLPQIALAEATQAEFAANHEALMAKIEAIRDFILTEGRLTASFTGSDTAYGQVREQFLGWAQRFRLGAAPAPVEEAFPPFPAPERTGLAAPMQVSYCACVLRAPYAVDPRAAVLTVGASLINHNYMTPEIRLKGNAYGASFSFHSLGGTFSMGSYRDPHLARTLGVFEGVRDYVSKAEWSQADVDQAIINTAKNDDRPIRPGDATASSLIRHLSGLTPEWREARYRGLRAATPGAVKSALLDALEAGRPTATVCVVSNRERLEEANRELGAKPLAIANILPS